MEEVTSWRRLEGSTCFRELLGLKPGRTVALMGAGGKHTLMARLEAELTAAEMPVLLTSSTNLHRPLGKREPELFLAAENETWRSEVEQRLDRRRPVYLLQHPMGKGMLKGLSMDLLQALRREHPEAVMVVKTDGARKRSLKAPGPNEPVIPPFADVCVAIAASDCIGAPLADDRVHRPELVARLADLELGAPVTTETVARVMGHRQSYPGRLPAGARSVLYLSKVSNDSRRRQASEVFQQLATAAYSVLAAGDTIDAIVDVYRDRPAGPSY